MTHGSAPYRNMNSAPRRGISTVPEGDNKWNSLECDVDFVSPQRHGGNPFSAFSAAPRLKFYFGQVCCDLFFCPGGVLRGFLVFLAVLCLSLILGRFDTQSLCRMIPAQVEIEPGRGLPQLPIAWRDDIVS